MSENTVTALAVPGTVPAADDVTGAQTTETQAAEAPAAKAPARPAPQGDPNPFWGRSGFLALMAVVFLPLAWMLAILRPQGHRFAALVGTTAFAIGFALLSTAAITVAQLVL